MKNPLSLFFAMAAFLLLMAAGCSSCHPQQTITVAKQAALYGEDLLDLSKNPLEKVDGKKEMADFKKNILIDSTDTLSPIQDVIPYDSISFLRKAAQKLGSGTDHHVLGVKIKYAYSAKFKKFALYYEPLYLAQDSSNTGGKSNIKYKAYAKDKYIYLNGKFKLDTTTNYIREYEKHITFKHPGTSYFSKYLSATDSTGSVDAVIFSFQEIDSVALENSVDSVYICNAAEQFKIGTMLQYKQVVLLGYDDVTKLAGKIFYGKFGNLAHLCPPNCDKCFYDLGKK